MINSTADYLLLSKFYDNCFEQFGATPQGVDWPNQVDLNKRFQVMLDVIQKNDLNKRISLLDMGCGYGALIDYLKHNSLIDSIDYTGIDISEKMITAAKSLHPNQRFYTQDILQYPLADQSYDYVIMNGIFTEKRQLSWQAMYNFMQSFIAIAFKTCRKGIAFNVMSYAVDWSNLSLFHCSYNDIARCVIAHCSRHYLFRSDYGLYEYTTYVYRHPN